MMRNSIDSFGFAGGDAKGKGQAEDVAVGASSGEHFGQDGGARQRTARRIPRKLYRIGEIIEFTGLSRQTIHNYTSMGILREAKRTNGDHRLYDESVFGQLELIKKLKMQRRTLEQIRDYFRDADLQAGVADEG